MSANKVLFIVNPISGTQNNSSIAELITHTLKNYQIKYNLIYTPRAGYAKKYVYSMNASLYKSILILGGDGTINEIINGILLRTDGYLPTLGFLPGGTGNSVLHDLEYLNPLSALQPFLENNIKLIDVMSLKFEKFIEYSINILGWGLVSDIALFAERLRFLGASRYNLASIYYILQLKERECTILIDGEKHYDKYLFILIHNTIHTGKGMKAAPHAKLDDGLLDIVLVNNEATRFQLIQLLSQLSDGSHIQSKYVQYIQAKTIELFPERNEAVNIDGDVKYKTPVKISVLKKKLPIFF